MTNYIVRSLLPSGRFDHSYTINCELRRLDVTSSHFSLLRVFDRRTPTRGVDAGESHSMDALNSRRHGLNRY